MLVHTESRNMPQWAEANPTSYWDAADTYERTNGRLYKEVEFALPRELDNEARLELARTFANDLTAEKNLPYTLALHEGYGENPHAHLLISERMNDGIERDPDQWFSRYNRDHPELGGAEKTDSLKPKAWLEDTRELWAQEANHALEQEGYTADLDHRSLEAQGIERAPTVHLGPQAMAMEEQGIITERGDQLREIYAFNDQVLALRKELEHEHERALDYSQEHSRHLDRDAGLGL